MWELEVNVEGHVSHDPGRELYIACKHEEGWVFNREGWATSVGSEGPGESGVRWFPQMLI